MLKLLDALSIPFVYLAARLLYPFAKLGWAKVPAARNAALKAGVLPVRRFYYSPQMDFDTYDEDKERDLPGIDLNEKGQRQFLTTLTYASEINFPLEGRGTDYFHFGPENNQFGQGDAEVLYQVLRAVKPRRLVEIGSGWSSKVAVEALAVNKRAGHLCRHVCIEPYEDRGLERMGVELIRQRVEDVKLSLFEELEAGDILFIDSTHIIRPQGDVLYEYLTILPRLKPGVIVHVHDIFTPRNYPKAWIVDDLRLWNEQYLLEGILSGGNRYQVLLANNWMHKKGMLTRVAPHVLKGHNPGSFYFRVR